MTTAMTLAQDNSHDMTTLRKCTASRRPFVLTCSAAGNAFAPGNNGRAQGIRPQTHWTFVCD